MNKHSPGGQALTGLAILSLVFSSACFGPTQGSASLQQVDDVVTQVERVQVECELAKDSIRETVTAMIEMVAPKGTSTVVEAFEVFETSIEVSSRQEKTLKDSVARLERSGTGFFEGWNRNLESFATQRLRIQSRTRLEETQGLFDAIMLSTQDPMQSYAEFQVAVQDVALYLSVDFNASSVRGIEGELRSLIRVAGELQRELDTCLDNTQRYISFAGLPNRVEVVEEGPDGQPDGKPVDGVEMGTQAVPE